MRGGRLLGVVIGVGWLLIPAQGGSGGAAGLHFTDVTAAVGIDVQGLGNASAWFDYDGDSDMDLMASDSDFAATVYLYRNNGDGTFTDVTLGAGLADAAMRSVSVGDFDNDGWIDFVETTYRANDHAHLYHNNGDGTFSDIGSLVGFVGSRIPWRVAAADFDRDGWLDLFQANLGADLLYHNDGDGTFTEVSRYSGVDDGGSSSAAAWGDFDNDGWPDLYVADDGPDHLYRNDRDGRFTDVASASGVSDGQDSVSACWGDFDNDTRLDLYVVNIGGQSTRNHLYRNRGDGTFADMTAFAGVGDVGDGRTCNWLDVDNDGKLDLFATNHVHANRLFRNLGNRRFSDVAGQAGISQPGDTFNGAWGDFDGDGDLDVFAVGHFDNVLYRNDGGTGGWVQLDLVGTRSNRSAIGARAAVLLGGRPENRGVEGSSGAYGADSPTLEFGLGATTGDARVRILWPDGAVQSLSVQANTRTTVVEPNRPA